MERMCQGGELMPNIFDTAKYILERQGKMSTAKLQKLCYYAQAWSLAWDDEPLFDEEFEAWANGPVCRELFVKTKGTFSVTAKDETGGLGDLSENQKDTINRALDYYASHDAQWLSQLTHLEDPWNEAREGVAPGMNCNNIISKESIAMYYGGL